MTIKISRLNSSSNLNRKRSHIINQKRTNQLVARNKALIKLLNKTQISLLKKCRSDSNYYSALLKKLILEGLVKMMEPVVIIYCLQRDKVTVQDLLKECEQEFKSITKKELGESRKVKLILNDKVFLGPRELVDLSDIDIALIDEHHETSIKINHMDDDKFW